MPAPIGNKYAVGNNGGRPPIYDNPEDLIKQCDEYFDYIKGEFHMEQHQEKDPETGKTKKVSVKVWDRYPEPATITGLALFLGFDSKTSLYEYGKKEEFMHPIKKARMRVEHEYEKCLYNDKPTGAIFALKNMDWDDKQDVNLKNNGGSFTGGLSMMDLPEETRQQIIEAKRARLQK